MVPERFIPKYQHDYYSHKRIHLQVRLKIKTKHTIALEFKHKSVGPTKTTAGDLALGDLHEIQAAMGHVDGWDFEWARVTQV